jgi:hypothetical protein
VDEAMAALPKTRADLLFLDVQLARRTGFDLQSLPSGDAALILRDGTELRVSRSRRDAIRAALGV